MNDRRKTKAELLAELTELKRRITDLQAREWEQGIHQRISHVLFTVPDSEMYAEALQMVLEATASPIGVFGYIDEDGALVYPSMMGDVWEECGVPDKSNVFPRESWGDSIWARSLREARTMVSNVPGRVPEGHVPIERVLVVPIVYRGDVIGHFMVANRSTDYTEADQRLVEGIADHMAPVLNARLQRDREERARQAAERELAEHRDRLEEALSKSEHELAIILDSMSELVAYHDREMRIQWANWAAANSLGLAPYELTGRYCYELWGDGGRPCVDCPVEKAMATARPQEGERTDRHGKSWFIRGYPLKNEEGEVIGAVEVTQDITERKRVAELDRQFAERLATLTEVAAELSQVPSFDLLCRRAVELGRQRLGFDRISIWFRTEDPNVITGSFGIDEAGNVRDERGVRAPGGPAGLVGQALAQEPVLLTQEGPLRNHEGRVVGYGAAAYARVWDGAKTLGCMCVDNLLSQRPITQRDCEIVRLYASVLGHLCSLKRAEEALRHERDLLQSLMDNIPDTIYFKDAESRFTRINKAQQQMLGVETSEQAVGKTDFDFFTPEHAQDAYQDEQNIVRTGQPVLAKVERVRRANGKFRWMSTTKVPILDVEGQVTGIVGISRDITQQVEAQQALQKSEERYRLHFERATDILYTLDPKTFRFTDVSPSVEMILGYRPDELIGTCVLDVPVRSPESVEQMKRRLEKMFSGAKLPPQEYEVVAKDGRSVIIESTIVPFVHDGKVVEIRGTARDVTQRKKAEQEKLAASRLYEDTVSTIPSSLLLLDPELRILMVNRRYADVNRVQPQDLVGKHVTEVFPASLLEAQGLLERMQRIALAGGQEELLRLKHTSPDHADKFLDIRICGVPSPEAAERRNQVLLVIDDVTDQEKLQDQLLHLQKMEAIGTLAGGVAHDFNNLLTGILGYASMLKLKSAPGGEAFRAAEMIERAAERAAELTRQLLGFARRGKHQEIPVDVNEVVRDVVSLLTHTIDRRIVITQRLSADESTVMGDPAQMQQVALNLAINARDAMPEGGELGFETQVVELDSEYCKRHPGAEPGRYIMIAVTDTGCGIPENVRDRIFEPFFTTKPAGEGTGMGLATVYGIVRNHGGTVQVYTEEGIGTTFKVYLPLAGGAVAPQWTEPLAVPARGTGRILLVDDEEVVRSVAADILRQQGYQVTTAADGREAVDYYEQHSHEVDLVILDMVMPRMSGRDCFRAMKAVNPDVKAILSTGFGLNGVAQALLSEGMIGFVQKPYQVRELSAAVAEALRQAGS